MDRIVHDKRKNHIRFVLLKEKAGALDKKKPFMTEKADLIKNY